jgi:hypothetical protein
MKRFDGFTTLDGAVHASLDAATRHADRIYSNALHKHADALRALDWKYTAFLEYLDAHADELAMLPILRDDAKPPKLRVSECDCNGIQHCDKCE